MILTSVDTEVRIYCPDGRVNISVSARGLVLVSGSQERTKKAWYLDKLKHAEEALKRGKCIWSAKSDCYVIRAKDIVIQSQEPIINRPYFKKLFAAARDTTRRWHPEKPLPVVKAPVNLGPYTFYPNGKK